MLFIIAKKKAVQVGFAMLTLQAGIKIIPDQSAMQGNAVAGKPAVFFLVDKEVVNLGGQAVFILKPVIINHCIFSGIYFGK